MIKIEKEWYEGLVYDLEMENDHNFFADGVCVHNCAKKRYGARVLDNEGVRYSEPDIAITGIETNRSSTPDIVRDWLMEAITILLETGDQTKVNEYVETRRQQFNSEKIENIAFPRSANNLVKYRDKQTIYTSSSSVPIGVRAALLYNHEIDRRGLQDYAPIMEGDKIKFIYLREPNTLKENVIGFVDDLPTEFGLHKYIDYELQFSKVFLDPLTKITEAIGWKPADSSDLSDFF